MAPGALVAIGIAVALWPATAMAQGGKKLPPASSVKAGAPKPPPPKPLIAVIDVRGDDDGRVITTAVLDALRRPAYRSLEATLIAALSDDLGPEDDARHITSARDFLTSSRESLIAFDASGAATQAQNGQNELLFVNPTPETTALLADLALAQGQALFVDTKLSDARKAFALVRRLTPERTLDARYTPELIAAYKSSTSKATTTLSILAKGSIWVDGRMVGTGDGKEPLAYKVETGTHVVVAFGPERDPRGQLVDASVTQVSIADFPADLDVKVKRARRALIAAPDPTARATAVERIARLTGIDCAFLVTRDLKTGGPAIQRWLNEHGVAVSAWPESELRGFRAVPLPSVTEVDPILRTLLPPVPEPDVITPGPVVPPGGPVDTTNWWEPRWVQMLGGGALLSAVFIGAYLISTAGAEERLCCGVNGKEPE